MKLQSLLLAPLLMLLIACNVESVDAPVNLSDESNEPVPNAISTPLTLESVFGTQFYEYDWDVPTIGRPMNPKLVVTMSISWISNADGFDVIVDGVTEASVTEPRYTFSREDTVEYVGVPTPEEIASIVPAVEIVAWNNDSDDELTQPVTWVSNIAID